jgi:hypothetical protein
MSVGWFESRLLELRCRHILRCMVNSISLQSFAHLNLSRRLWVCPSAPDRVFTGPNMDSWVQNVVSSAQKTSIIARHHFLKVLTALRAPQCIILIWSWSSLLARDFAGSKMAVVSGFKLKCPAPRSRQSSSYITISKYQQPLMHLTSKASKVGSPQLQFRFSPRLDRTSSTTARV